MINVLQNMISKPYYQLVTEYQTQP